MNKKRVLITGVSGLLGAWIAEAFDSRNWHVIGICRTGYKDFPVNILTYDLTHTPMLSQLFDETQPDLVIHCAAESRVSECENDPTACRKHNVQTTRDLAEITGLRQLPFVFFSSDMVFSGFDGPYHEESKPNPPHIYGQSKLEAEELIQFLNPNHFIFRIGLIIGKSITGRSGVVDQLITASRSGTPYTAFSDEFRTPVNARIAANLVAESIEKNIPYGTYHLGGDHRVSRFQLAKDIAEALQLGTEWLQTGSLASFSGYPPRQADLSLINIKLKTANQVASILPFTTELRRSPFKSPFQFDLPVLQ